MIFVCAVPPELDGRLDETLARLYAYPRRPEPRGSAPLVILDSGAFALSQQGRRIDQNHMRALAAHYHAHRGTGVWCMAPDVYLDPNATMSNWTWWRYHVGIPVVPVVQFTRAGVVDLYSAARQAAFYAAATPDVIAVSNNALTASEAGPVMAEACALIREKTGASWLHLLGGGWSPGDLARWRDLDCVQSMDTIAYYTDARRGWRWRRDGKRERVDDAALDWRDLAVHNARVADEVAHGTHVHDTLVLR